MNIDLVIASELLNGYLITHSNELKEYKSKKREYLRDYVTRTWKIYAEKNCNAALSYQENDIIRIIMNTVISNNKIYK